MLLAPLHAWLPRLITCAMDAATHSRMPSFRSPRPEPTADAEPAAGRRRADSAPATPKPPRESAASDGSKAASASKAGAGAAAGSGAGDTSDVGAASTAGEGARAPPSYAPAERIVTVISRYYRARVPPPVRCPPRLSTSRDRGHTSHVCLLSQGGEMLLSLSSGKAVRDSSLQYVAGHLCKLGLTLMGVSPCLSAVLYVQVPAQVSRGAAPTERTHAR